MSTEPSVTISVRSAELAVNCVESCANDPREPERYREWYTEVANELRHGIAMAKLVRAGCRTPRKDN